MKKHSNTFKTGDIVVVAFPFTDSDQTKNRPALVLSDESTFNRECGHTVLAMITSSMHTAWPLDIPLIDLKSCGLLKPSLIRFKTFTLDNRLIKEKIGTLATKDLGQVKKHIRLIFL